MLDLMERVLSIARCFEAAGIPHSFGGAIALAYYGRARGTRDIDINVYVTVRDADRVLALLEGLGVTPAGEAQRTRIQRDAQVRLFWQAVPIDLFFSNIDFHASCRRRRHRHVLGDQQIHVLAPEDLIVCKVAFAREKDGRDIDTVLETMGAQLDLVYVLRWVDEIAGADHPSAIALRGAIARFGLDPAGVGHG